MRGAPGESVGIGLLGYGTVGSAVDRLLQSRAADIERVAGRSVRVVRALVRQTAGRDADLVTDRFDDLLDDDRIDVVAEVMGGVEPTRGYVLALLERGIPVVSANKQLLSQHGEELFAAAERHGAQLRFEAAVCAAVPVVKVLRESLIAGSARELVGIVNGTTNFILSAMAREGRSYADALAEAQRLGYAEADPADDVTGADAAAKVAILASIAFHTRLRLADVPYEGIDGLALEDLAFAQELGYAVKLLGRARLEDGGVLARVAPTLVPHAHPLARVEGSMNAVLLRGDEIGELTLQGPGAGGRETASAVVGDLLGVIGTEGTGFLQHDGFYRSLPLASGDDAVGSFYLRLVAHDRPGVLAGLAGGLAERGVSVETLLQRPRGAGEADLVLLTHPAPEGAMLAAVDAVAGRDLGRERPRVLRVLR
jgi:homoserine dehydrogenase